jgi:hypothetical protein
MRNRALRGCLVLVLAVFCVFLENVGSIAKELIKPPANSAQAQKIPEADKRGTLDAPLIVKSIPSEKSQQETDDDARKKDEKRWNDRVAIFIGIATGIILFLQLIVFGWQARRLKQTIDTMKDLGSKQSDDMHASIAIAKESADAAKKSSDSLIASQRAFVCVHEPWWAAIPRKGGGHDYIFGVQWFNGGNTPTKGMRTFTDHYLSEKNFLTTSYSPMTFRTYLQRFWVRKAILSVGTTHQKTVFLMK